jgi:inner membrane protein
MKIEINDNKKLQYSLTIKIVVLAFLGLFLLIPLEMIKSIIKERQKNAEEVKKEIAFQWAGQQVLSGPVLNIPVRLFPSKKEFDPYVSVFHLMPETLSIKADVQTEKRHKSIYQTVVYTADLNISGTFVIPELIAGGNGEVLWNDAYFTMGISDNRGLKGTIQLKTDNGILEAIPGLKDADLFITGISFPANLTIRDKKFSFSESLKLSGSEGLSFAPVGKTTEVVISSKWNSPGFKGNFLPVERLINEAGFNAKWLVTNLNRNFPQTWSGKAYNTGNDLFGVDFILPVDHYQKSLRSAKYGILFIALTFMALIFSELAIKEKIHVFHYIMVSLGLVLFFSLLTALSEYIGFNFAYLTASTSIIILISFFLMKLFKKRITVYLISGLLVLLYAFIFILLTLNDFAYLAGNIGLFVLLAATMLLSVKLDLFKNQADPNIPLHT